MTDVFDPARLDAIRSRQVFDKARDEHDPLTCPCCNAAASVLAALKSVEPTPDARAEARAVACRETDCATKSITGGHTERCDLLTSAIAAAIARATAATRAETIEECAKLFADMAAELRKRGAGRATGEMGDEFEAQRLDGFVEAIRALGGAR